jgi:hypothetical protein
MRSLLDVLAEMEEVALPPAPEADIITILLIVMILRCEM